jgi:hypothetical protein
MALCKRGLATLQSRTCTTLDQAAWWDRKRDAVGCGNDRRRMARNTRLIVLETRQ